MLFNIFTTSSPAKLAAATTTRAGSQPQRASPSPAPISKLSKLRGIFQSLRRFVAPPKDAHHCHPQGAPTHARESSNIPGFATSSATPFPIVPTINSIQLTPSHSVATTWVPHKSPVLASDLATARKKIAELESTPDHLHAVIERLNADTRRDSGRSWSSSWFEFERITAGSEPQRAGSAWQDSEPSDVSEGEETCSDSESGECSRASTDPSASFQWSNEGLAWANSGSGSPSPSPTAESLRRMPRGRQGGRMYAMRVTSAYGSSTDEDDLLR